MTQRVLCVGVLAGVLCLAAPALAQANGYITVSKLQIDPHMPMIDDGSGQKPPQSAPGAAQSGQADAGVPLDQMGADDQDADNGPAGDDPYSDNAAQTDTVYTA